MTGNSKRKSEPKKNRRKRRDKAHLLDTAIRRSFVLREKLSGLTYEEVAEKAKEHFGTEKLPKGYDKRYVYKDVIRELERQQAENAIDVESLREMMGAQCDKLLLSVWPIATAPHNPKNPEDEVKTEDRFAAIDRVLRVMERKDKLFGVSVPKEKAPQQHQHHVLALHAQLPQLPQFGEGSPLLQLSDDGMTMVMRLEKMLVGGNGQKELPGPEDEGVVVDGEYEEINTDGEVE